MSEDLFLKIIAREIPADIVFENERVLAFRDINPQAPLHVLVIPKTHVRTVNELTSRHDALLGEMVRVAAEIAATEGHAEDGYRLVMNCGERGGQSVFHIHLHLLAGRDMHWPPG